MILHPSAKQSKRNAISIQPRSNTTSLTLGDYFKANPGAEQAPLDQQLLPRQGFYQIQQQEQQENEQVQFSVITIQNTNNTKASVTTKQQNRFQMKIRNIDLFGKQKRRSSLEPSYRLSPLRKTFWKKSSKQKYNIQNNGYTKFDFFRKQKNKDNAFFQRELQQSRKQLVSVLRVPGNSIMHRIGRKKS